MTRDEIIEMAKEAGLVSPFKQYKDWIEAGPSGEELIAFAKLVAAKEREACADICENAGELMNSSFKGAANAIRARGEA